MTTDDSKLDDFFQKYRAACPEVEPRANFMPRLWELIEARHSFWFVFGRFARTAMTASAALCLVLLLLNFVVPPQTQLAPTYVDALMADHTAEKTYYTEAIRTSPSPERVPGSGQR